MAEPDLILGDFRIERRLGTGGMGVVYLARSLGSPLTDSDSVARFRRAAQAAAKLRHPGIAAIYHIGQDDTACYVAMEYIDGAPLDAIIRRLRTAKSDDSLTTTGPAQESRPTPSLRFDTDATGEYTPDPAVGGPLSAVAADIRRRSEHIRRAVEIIRDAARALDFAHTQSVIHRDIKPGNLMLDTDGRVVVIDFGLARFFEDESVTVTGQLVGTPMYMSPEQVTGRLTLDARTDVYSLGLVLYELLTLLPPLRADNREQLLRKVVTKPLSPLRKVNPDMPAEVEAITHTATAKDPDGRYPTAGALADDLDRFLSGKPVVARPYQYAADEQQIINTRPNGVLFVAVVQFFYALMAFMYAVVIFLSFVLLAQYLQFGLSHAISFPLTFGVPLVIFWIGRRLMWGAIWSRYAAILFQVCFVVLIAGLGISTAHDPGISPGTFVSGLGAFGLLGILSVSCIWILTLKSVRAWFITAQRIRSGQIE